MSCDSPEGLESETFSIWREAALLALEGQRRPSALLGVGDVIIGANDRFSELLGCPAKHIIGTPWSQLLNSPDGSKFDARAREYADGESLLRAAGGGYVVARTGSAPLGGGASSPRIVTVLFSRRVGSCGSTTAIRSYAYEINRHPDRRSELLMLEDTERPASGRLDRVCHEALHERATPCDGCEAQSLGLHEVRTQCCLGTGDDFTVRVFTCVDEARVRVDVTDIAPDTLSELVQAKIQHLARTANMSEQECEVMELLFLGRSIKDIAMLLDLGERTVKYSQSTILRRLGVSARSELASLLF